MTVKEAMGVLAVLSAAYPGQYKTVTPETAGATATVWAHQFADVPLKIVMIAIEKWISVNHWAPKPCEIRKEIAGLYWEADSELRANSVAHHLSPKRVEELKQIRTIASGLRANSQGLSLNDTLKVLEEEKGLSLIGRYDNEI